MMGLNNEDVYVHVEQLRTTWRRTAVYPNRSEPASKSAKQLSLEVQELGHAARSLPMELVESF